MSAICDRVSKTDVCATGRSGELTTKPAISDSLVYETPWWLATYQNPAIAATGGDGGAAGCSVEGSTDRDGRTSLGVAFSATQAEELADRYEARYAWRRSDWVERDSVRPSIGAGMLSRRGWCVVLDELTRFALEAEPHVENNY